MINNLQPTLAISVHYNALPDDGDALNTQGIGIFWYHPQAADLSVFLHDYLTKNLSRPSYGVFWNNLALTRPYSSPSLLLELGFMSNPQEFAGDRIFWSLYLNLRKLNQVHGKNVTSEQQSDKITARLQGIVHHSLVDIQTAIAL